MMTRMVMPMMFMMSMKVVATMIGMTIMRTSRMIVIMKMITAMLPNLKASCAVFSHVVVALAADVTAAVTAAAVTCVI